MIRFNVPFLPDSGYVDFLAGLGRTLHCVHFPLDLPEALSARPRAEQPDREFHDTLLGRLIGVKKYGLINARFHDPALYCDRGRLETVCRHLDRMADADLLDGIVFTDAYHLRALSAASPETASRLEAVPGVNCMADTPHKARALVEWAQEAGFRRPGKFVPDRSLNRRPRELQAVAESLRAHYPGMLIELLANEGCLDHCPHKFAHDAVAAHMEIRAGKYGPCRGTFDLNRDLGCIRRLSEHPEKIFSSPFIRPEDVDRYEDACDLIKICGRTRGPEFLEATIRAYVAREYQGSLFDLLDASEWMNSLYLLPNHELPPDFSRTLSGCDRDCARCGYCRRVFEQSAVRRPLLQNLV